MTLDRDQVRRDAEEVVPCYDGYAVRFQEYCLALLTELEQAERERDEARGALSTLRDELPPALRTAHRIITEALA